MPQTSIKPHYELIRLLFPAHKSSSLCLLGLELVMVLSVAHLKASWLVKKNHLLFLCEDKVHAECKARSGNQYISQRFTLPQGPCYSLQLLMRPWWVYNMQFIGSFIINFWATQ